MTRVFIIIIRVPGVRTPARHDQPKRIVIIVADDVAVLVHAGAYAAQVILQVVHPTGFGLHRVAERLLAPVVFIIAHPQLDAHRGLTAGYAEAGGPGALGGAPGLVGPVHVPLVVGNGGSALVLVVAARPAEGDRLSGVEIAAPRAAHLLHGYRRQVAGYYGGMHAHSDQYTKKKGVFHGLCMDCWPAKIPRRR